MLRGEGRFIDDIQLAGTVHVAFVRSTHAHARILKLVIDDAVSAPGVVTVLTAKDLVDRVRPICARLESMESDQYRSTTWHPIATDKVLYVGEIVAMVVASDRYRAEDAAELVEVLYESLPAVVDVHAATGQLAASVHSDIKDNVLFRTHRVVGNEHEKSFANAVVRAKVSIRHPRVAGMSIETAGVVAVFDRAAAQLSVFSSTQSPHLIRDALSHCLGIPESRVSVTAPDVGGAFGPKLQLHPEELLVAHAARELNRPVKWIQDRSEHLVAGFHARDVHIEAEVAADRDGRILGLRARALCNAGAYSSFPFTCALEPQTIGVGLTGPYRVPYYAYEGLAIATNRYPTGAYRGVGFPLCPLVTETLLDRVAHQINEDPAQVRRRNLISSSELPMRNPAGALYDSGDYHQLLETALIRADYDCIRRQQLNQSSTDQRLGIGVSCFIELTAMNRAVFRARGMTHIPGFDSSLIRVSRDGSVEAYVSTPSQGQSQKTTFCSLLSDALGIDSTQVRIVLGDTVVTPYGSGTFASRSLVSGGGALLMAAEKLKTKCCRLAALLWQIDVEDVSFSKGEVCSTAGQEKRLSLMEIGEIVHSASHQFPNDWEPGLEVRASYDPPGVPVSCAAHVAIVEVDVTTGKVGFQRYIVAEDCGPLVDEAVVDGQIRGAVAQAIGSTLFEEIFYSHDGQHASATLQDYLVPGVFDVPRIDISHLQTPSPFSQGGFKGIAESGTIGGPAAIVNAVADALGVQAGHLELPLTPERVIRMYRENKL
ncbi:MAG: xanthine dehydrogenase family protein molybdopterin-binding subunit [Pseudomonadota bacterium]|nr:xanthine dehydrogenase family protein molybdopterin-binding subunit [Pseudomonadota bacterium]